MRLIGSVLLVLVALSASIENTFAAAKVRPGPLTTTVVGDPNPKAKGRTEGVSAQPVIGSRLEDGREPPKRFKDRQPATPKIDDTKTNDETDN